jgi:hypothetical protein
MFEHVKNLFRRREFFAAHRPLQKETRKPKLSEALAAWKMQFTEVDPTELSEPKAGQFAKIREEFPDAVVGRVGESEFACFVDARLGPTHVILRDNPQD